MRRVAVLGVGMTKFGVSTKSQVEMFAEAALEAINTSNLKPRDIQAVYVGNVLGDFEEGQMNIAPFCSAELGLPPEVPATRVEGACASGSVAIKEAFMGVAAGFYDIVLAGGTEKATAMGTPLATRTFAMATDSRYEEFTGITFPGVFALLSHLYAREYGIPLAELKEQMAMVAVKNHRHGARNPLAQFQKEITVETVFNSIMIADPLQLYDCCPFSDGAAAVVLAAEGIAAKLVPKPVYILGIGQASAGSLFRQRGLPRLVAREAAAKKAYSMAGLSPEDVHVCELHDCFTIAEIIASEGLGLCEFGRGGEAAMKGETTYGGRVVINPSGGLKAKGHPIGATGAAQVYEIVKQLRGEAGTRQVDGARVGLTDTLGGDASTVVVTLYGI
ncbi:thiolase domain-containing protein [Desulfofundulus sp. TPOSR]|uniref:thiolase domain-containing protein n=1 Tax=Desulfofundulus sp. TPOSR TaxID=2714340 RepID=UPI00140E5543|nr:thiolase domain-containing protein [Desulfofundulus sp. TPOSR]NHM25763.1 thiolase domain-containing protein [Desulfofundulus sp. TPOSR]